MSDIELILIDEGFSLIEYQESQLSQMNLSLNEQIEYDLEIVRVVDGRMNQKTLVYVIEVSKISEAINFLKSVENGEIIEVIEFIYAIRRGHIIILSDSLEILSLFDNI